MDSMFVLALNASASCRQVRRIARKGPTHMGASLYLGAYVYVHFCF